MTEKSKDQERAGSTAKGPVSHDKGLVGALKLKIKALEEELQVNKEELEIQNEELRVQLDELHIKNESLGHEIEARKHTEELLRLSEADLARAQQITRLGSWKWDLKADKIYCSDEFYRIFGLARQDFLFYRQFLDMVRPEDRDRVDRAVQAALRGESQYVIDYCIIRQDGKERAIHAEGQLILDVSRTPVEFFGTVQDITERKKADELLQKQASLIDLSPDAIIVRLLDGTITLWSHGAESLYGWTKAEAIGRRTHALIRSHFPEPLSRINAQLVESGRWSGELVHTTKDGRQVIVQSWWLAQKDRNGRVRELLESNVDITGLKRVENHLRESLENFSALADNIPQLAWMARPDGHIFWYNKQWFEFTGTTLEEMQGWGWQKVHHPDYIRRITDEWRQSLGTGTPFDDVFPLRGKDGEYRWFLTRVRPVRDEQGKIVRWFGTNTDITERKRLEGELMEAKNRAELYMDIMGHDINNLNQVIISSLELIKDDDNLTEEQREILTGALNSSNGSASIINNVRKIQAINEKKETMLPEDLDDMIEPCIREAPKPAERDIRINYVRGKGMMILGSALMKEVFCNLINNAIRHSEGDLAIDITVDRVVRYGKNFYDVSITDNGPGIPDKLKPRLFNRFQRGETKAHGKGLGLFIVKSLVEQAGGNVTVTDRISGDPSQGARFIVSLPSCEGCQ